MRGKNVQGIVGKKVQVDQNEIRVHLFLDLNGVEEEATAKYSVEEYNQSFPNGLKNNQAVVVKEMWHDTLGYTFRGLTLN